MGDATEATGGRSFRASPGAVLWTVRRVGSYGLPVVLVVLVLAPRWFLAVLLLDVVVGVAAALRLRVTVDVEGIAIRNLFRSHRYRWDDVDLVEWRGHDMWGRSHRYLGLRTRDGRDPEVGAVHTFGRRGQDRVEDALRRTAGRAGIPVETLDAVTR